MRGSRSSATAAQPVCAPGRKSTFILGTGDSHPSAKHRSQMSDCGAPSTGRTGMGSQLCGAARGEVPAPCCCLGWDPSSVLLPGMGSQLHAAVGNGIPAPCFSLEWDPSSVPSPTGCTSPSALGVAGAGTLSHTHGQMRFENLGFISKKQNCCSRGKACKSFLSQILAFSRTSRAFQDQ